MNSGSTSLFCTLLLIAFSTPSIADSTCEDMGLTTCGMVCVDLQIDDDHCGACFNACGYGTDCCGGTCIDVLTDPQNCGSCGRICDDFDDCTNDICSQAICFYRPIDMDGDGYVPHFCPGGTDCDDSNPNVNPGETEGPFMDDTCHDGLDNDCDVLTDLADTDCCGCTQHGDCDDGNVCTTDSCTQCFCENIPVSDGTGCHDDNARTQTDTCQSGLCIGSNPVVCTPLDQCHFTGVCNPATGICTEPPAPNGTPCTDENICTMNDICIGGVCVSGPLLDADSDGFISDACGGTDCDDSRELINPGESEGQGPISLTCYDTLDNDCDGNTDFDDWDCCECTQHGHCDDGNVCTTNLCAGCICTDELVADGTFCDDGNACTTDDQCSNGVCIGANPVVCAPVDQCRPGVCDPDTGLCSYPPAPNGSPCDDLDLCTQTDECVAGACVGANPVVCTPENQCHLAGTCNPSTGVCSHPHKGDLTPCDDGLYCTESEVCQNGSCIWTWLRECGEMLDQCNRPRCDLDLDRCIQIPLADGKPCDDEEPCTVDDACAGGICVGTPLDEDGDGHVSDECGGDDCDDTDSSIYLGATDWCNDGIDQDCNGSDLDCDCRDSDGDSYLDEACGGNDCDDGDVDIHPEADEVCHDEVDNDCDGDTDREDDDCCHPEDCDWVDDDCDGITDNMGTETCGLGPCQVTVEVCVDGVLQECVPLQPEEFMETSCTDGIDNDCDGNIDYDDLNCLGRTDAGDWWDGRDVTGGGCGCGTTGIGGLGLLLALMGLLVRRRNL